MINALLKIVCLFSLSILFSCGGGDESASPPISNPDPDVVYAEFDFLAAVDGWTVGFSDYPVGQEIFYELDYAIEQLPAPLDSMTGLMVTGNNHSDDLFMYIKKLLHGFKPNTEYDFKFQIDIATNVPMNCVGVGGSPGESVFILGAATNFEPIAELDSFNDYRMNIEFTHSDDFVTDSVFLGNFSNSKDCESMDYSYEIKSLDNNSTQYSAVTDENGSIWVLFGTDSGFEATTRIYYLGGDILGTEIL